MILSHLGAESLGGLAQDMIKAVTTIGCMIATCSASASISSHLFGRPAITLWHGNASLWLHCHPTLLPSLEGIVLACGCVCLSFVLFGFSWLVVLFLPFAFVFVFVCVLP